MTTVIEVNGLHKSFKDAKGVSTTVLDGISFTVPQGSVFAMLGANGAGKTTTVKILSTLLHADAGSAAVCGFDVSKQAEKVREVISLTGQFAAVDEVLTGRENLILIGKLRHAQDCKAKADELLTRFDLMEAADRSAATYSGGMRRRLDLAMSLLGSPQVLFLDEPTTGLDPAARAAVWKMIRNLKQSGVTVFLTTQYLEEADQLADMIAILGHGKIVAQGSAAELKNRLPHGTIELSFADEAAVHKAADLVGGEVNAEMLSLSVTTDGSARKISEVLSKLEALGVEILAFSQKQPTLDDVFFSVLEKGVA
jgi:ABC-2 type transport system ATP-binding protein